MRAADHGCNTLHIIGKLFLLFAFLVPCYLSPLFEDSRHFARKRKGKHMRISNDMNNDVDTEFNTPIVKRPTAAPTPQIKAPNVKHTHPTTDGDTLAPFRYSFEGVVKSFNEQPVSTFPAAVGTSSYSYMRDMLQSASQLPAPNTVRSEELVNYFDYDYPSPQDPSMPLEASAMISDSPWSPGRKIMSIGIKGYDPTKVVDGPCPRSNLVFLVDVSSTMDFDDGLPLVKESLEILLRALRPDDRVSIVTTASRTNIVLQPTLVGDRKAIKAAIRSLRAGGCTNTLDAFDTAYQVAAENFDEEGTNRIMLFSDGDFDLARTQRADLTRLISEKRDIGMFLSTFGYGMAKYNIGAMERLANQGNGVAVYIGSLRKAKKVLVQQAQSFLNTIAKDVKFQVEFNPKRVADYRLVGYENRGLVLDDDDEHAGYIGAGHQVTVLYEFTPVENNSTSSPVDDLQQGVATAREDQGVFLRGNPPTAVVDNEYAFLKMRYKLPLEDTPKLSTLPITDSANSELLLLQESGYTPWSSVSSIVREFRFAIAVAGFAELVKSKIPQGLPTSTTEGQMNQTARHSHWGWSDAIDLAERNAGVDLYSYRREFVNLARTAKSLAE